MFCLKTSENLFGVKNPLFKLISVIDKFVLSNKSFAIESLALMIFIGRNAETLFKGSDVMVAAHVA